MHFLRVSRWYTKRSHIQLQMELETRFSQDNLSVALTWSRLLLLQGGNVFAGKYGLITPRDLFKWATRGAVTYEELAENGFMLLGERLRSEAECHVVENALETVMHIKVNLQIRILLLAKVILAAVGQLLVF